LTYSDIYFTDQGAYYPYRSGKLYIYGKGIRWDYSGHQNDCDWISNICGDNSIRIGNDASNYWEYNGPSWNRNWQRYTVYLNNSRKVVGAPTWNGSIRYLGITYLGFSGCSSLTYGTCAVTQDIVSVEK
jgi:hypothetical protein